MELRETVGYGGGETTTVRELEGGEGKAVVGKERGPAVKKYTRRLCMNGAGDMKPNEFMGK